MTMIGISVGLLLIILGLVVFAVRAERRADMLAVEIERFHGLWRTQLTFNLQVDRELTKLQGAVLARGVAQQLLNQRRAKSGG